MVRPVRTQPWPGPAAVRLYPGPARPDHRPARVAGQHL